MKGASSTARLIAVSIVHQDEQGLAERWLPKATINLSRTMLGMDGWRGRALLRLLGLPWVRRLFVALERRVLPGIQAHYVLRKHRIANWAARTIDAGASQVLIFGAGMDGLGAELCFRHSGLTITEFDHPATQAIKRQALAKALPVCELRLLPVDLAGADAARQLEASGLSPHEPTLIIAEGVLMYLQPRACMRLLKTLLRLFHGKLDLVFSVMECNSHGKPGFAEAHPGIDHWLHWRGEPFLWAAGPDRVARTLTHRNIEVREIARGDEPPEAEFQGWSPCTGETLYRATRK